MQEPVGKFRIGLLSFSPIRDDPRVRRHGDALAAAGYRVTAIGLGGGRSAAPTWQILDIDAPDTMPYAGWQRWKRRTRWITASLLSRLVPQSALSAQFALDGRAEPMLCLARQFTADVWIANDWNTLPIGRRLASEQGALLIYDSHEFATEEYSQSLRWRLFNRPFRKALESSALGRVRSVITVSEGIATRLARLYSLAEIPLVVRNMPRFEPSTLRQAGQAIRVLYHGIVAPGRGLEDTIASVPLWRQEFALTIRGQGTPEYLAHLERLATQSGAGGRVSFADPVAMIDLVRAASLFDIGILALPDHSAQNTYALPNKFFEYVMAGLALCVTDLPEMAPLMSRYRLGQSIAGSSPEAIAAAINAFDRPSIDAAKANALAAARELCWDEEQKILLACIAKLVSEQPAAMTVRA